MYNYKIENSFVSPKRPKIWANETDNNLMIFNLILVKNCMFQNEWEPVLSQRILIGFEAILESGNISMVL